MTKGIAKIPTQRYGDTAVSTVLAARRRIFVVAVLCAAFLALGSPVWAAEGDLDTSFSGDGKVTTPVGVGHPFDAARDVAVQADGKVVLGGRATGVGTGADFALARYDADGELDSSFGTGGSVLTNMGSQDSGEDVSAVALQADGKIVAAGSTGQDNVPPNELDIAVARYNPNGTLDTSFSGDGKFTLDLGGTTEFASDLAVQSDGKIVVAGTVDRECGTACRDFVLVRLNPGGTLDTTFDTDGIVVTDVIPAASSDSARAIAVQSNGRIVAAGEAGPDFAMVRYNTNGTLDTTFDTDGKVTTDMGSTDDDIRDVALETGGKIVVAGEASNTFAVARYNTNGALDTTLDSDGKVFTDFGSCASASGLVVASNNKVTVAGTTCVDGNSSDFALARYNTNGALDSSFAGDGKRTTDFGDTADNADGMALQPDGKAVVAGGTGAGFPGRRFALARFGDSGNLDSTFSFDGKAASVVGTGGEDLANAVALQPDGKTIVAGRSPGGRNFDNISVVRYNKNGSLDTSFGGDGKVLTELEVGSVGEAVTVQPDGKILVTGSVQSVVSRFALARYNPDGTPDTTFSGDGIQTTGFGDVGAQAEAIALQPNGKVVVSGTLFLGGDQDFALVRYNSNGALDTTFDTDGKVSTPIGPGRDLPRAMTLQGNKIIVAGFAEDSADTSAEEDFAVARYNANGSLDTTFDGDGRVTTPVGEPDTDESVQAVLAQPDGKIVLGGEAEATGFDRGFALARYNTDGALDTTFNGDGTLLDPALDGTVQGLALQQGKIVAAGGSVTDFVVARYNPGGSRDSTFSGDGVQNTDFGSSDRAFAVAVGADSRITVAGSARNGNLNDDFAVARYIGDSTAPTITSVAPAENATGVAPSANVSAIFSEEMTAASINANTFSLFKAGTTAAIGTSVSYSATTKKATLNPNTNLTLGTKYKAVISTEVRDLAGNQLDQNPGAAGIQQKAWFFTVRD